MGRHMINDRVNAKARAKQGEDELPANADADARQNEFAGGTSLIKSSLKYLFIWQGQRVFD